MLNLIDYDVANLLLDCLHPDVYSDFVRHCEREHGMGPTALCEDDPHYLVEELLYWLKLCTRKLAK